MTPLDDSAKAGVRAALDHDDVAAAYLFGSQARGRPGPLSDVDVAVWANPDLDPRQRFELRLRLTNAVSRTLDGRLSIWSCSTTPHRSCAIAPGATASCSSTAIPARECVFASLGTHGTIETDLAKRLGSAAGLRNLLVHDYGDIDHARVWDSLGDLDDLRAFAAAADQLARA